MEQIYFGLLWEHELKRLRPVLTALSSSRELVLAKWWELYCLHFGERRSLSKAEFDAIHGRDFDATIQALKRNNFDNFVKELAELGKVLAERQVSFVEVMASMHLFEEATFALFPEARSGELYRLFDKISHCRLLALAESYFAFRMASATARIEILESEASHLSPEARVSFHGMVGASLPMRALYEQIQAVARVSSCVLIVGESGTGKEMVARAIHECSPRSRAPFIPVNCAAIPRELIESELFGYQRGAFSGASSDYLGLFRAADGGTILLDEISEMSTAGQAKLLRVLQEGKVRPVGSTREIPVDVRVIASTNRDPIKAVREGILREDLYYRLSVNTLTVPPLRERLDDLPLLVEHFIRLFNEKLKRDRPILGVDEAALVAMRHHTWPGNVRELSNVIERAFTFCKSSVISLADLPFGNNLNSSRHVSPDTSFSLNIADHQRALLLRALTHTGGNKAKAAKLLGISRRALYAKMKRYGLKL